MGKERLGMGLLFVLSLSLSAFGDVVFLKGGQKIEGEVADKGATCEIKTELGLVKVSRQEVERIVRSLSVLEAEAEALHEKARALYEAALALERDPSAATKKLKEGVDLLKQAAALYNEAVETYTDDKYAHISQKLVKLFQEMRLYRDRMSADRGSTPPPPGEKESPVADKKPVPEPPPPPSPAEPRKPPAFPLEQVLAQAKGGDLEAQVRLGMYYEDREYNPAEALKWYKQAAGKNHARAQIRMGRLYLEGRGVKQDFKEAQKWFSKPTSKSAALACFYLGGMHFGGKGFRKSADKADEVCEKGACEIHRMADAGDPEAQVAIGWIFQEGIGLYYSIERALEYYKKAAEQDYTPAMSRLGDLYVFGKRVEKNREEAQKWYRRAAEAGDPEGQVNLALTLMARHELFNHRGGETADFPPALELFQKAAAKGRADGQYWLAVLYRSAAGVPRDDKKCLELLQAALKNATDTSLPMIINDLANSYRLGEGTPKDPKKAMEYFRMAAQTGDPHGQFNMGALYHEDMGDLKEAAKWFAMAARQGHMWAQNNLGTFYYEGKGVRRDLAEAERWFLMAAQQGAQFAINNLKRVQEARQAEGK